MRKNNIIKINGRHYDADSGALITPAVADVAATPGAGHLVHDVIKPPEAATRRSPQPAKTLMRTSVKKPARPAGKPLRAQSQVDAAGVSFSAPQPVLGVTDTKRLQHAKQITKSDLISRFGAPVKTGAAPAAATPAAGDPVTVPANPDLLQHALEQATSHKQPPLKHVRRDTRKRRVATTAAVAVVAIGLLALFTTQNLNSVRLQVASAKAGFSAALPGYKPSGFRLGQLSYSAGVVAFNYVSNSDQDRRFLVIEKASSWDSQALRDSFVVPTAGQNYQTVQAAGQTYYLYGSQNVTWVSGGVWYQVQSKDALGNQQLIVLAKSL